MHLDEQHPHPLDQSVPPSRRRYPVLGDPVEPTRDRDPIPLSPRRNYRAEAVRQRDIALQALDRLDSARGHLSSIKRRQEYVERELRDAERLLSEADEHSDGLKLATAMARVPVLQRRLAVLQGEVRYAAETVDGVHREVSTSLGSIQTLSEQFIKAEYGSHHLAGYRQPFKDLLDEIAAVHARIGRF